MKVLITGGAGYIGSHCNKYFMETGMETVVLDNLSFGHEEAVTKEQLIVGDFGDGELLNRIFKQHEILAVVHFAALADVADSMERPADYYETNVLKMKVLLDQMVKHKIPYLIFSSSASVFGEPITVPIDEEHPKQPVNPYGTTKLIGEWLLQDYERAYGIRYCAMRYFNAAGAASDGSLGEAHEPEHHILPLIFQTALGKWEQFSVFGQDYETEDGTCVRDYIHVKDLASAHFLALLYLIDGGMSQAFNLGNDKGYSVLEVIRSFEEVAGQKLNVSMAGRRAGDPARLVANNRKAKLLLGWEPQNSHIETIIETAWRWENHKKF